MTQTATQDTARPLTAKRQRFVQEYLVDLNATQAAIRAGYSERTATAIGCENITKPDVALAIQEAQAERSKRTGVTVDRVLDELARIAFASISDAIEWGPDGATVRSSAELSPEVLAAVSEVSETRLKDRTVTIRLKMHDKLAALHKVAEHLGMFTQQIEITKRSLSIEAALDGLSVEELRQLLSLGDEAKALETATQDVDTDAP